MGAGELEAGDQGVGDQATGELDHGASLAQSESPKERRDWWSAEVAESVLDFPQWVTFDLKTILVDTLDHSPLIQSVSRESSIALERIVQQDAEFDPRYWFESQLGRTNDPVGNALTTGGPPRLIEESLVLRAGVDRSGRRGTTLGLSQEAGLLDSNSTFFDPTDQANARLSLSLSQPLLARGGQAYNERLLTQARIDSRVSWQEMRGDVEGRLADVITNYWRLYEVRCHLLQQNELLKRAHRIEEIVEARRNFDAGAIERAKTRQRVARRADSALLLQAEVKRQQTRLARLIGSAALIGSGALELIPRESPGLPEVGFDLQSATVQGLENRPEVRAAAHDLESAALSIQVTRVELMPELTGVVDAYLSGLNGRFNVVESLTDQFTRGGPGISAGLRYDLPAGGRAAKSRHREAFHRYQQRSEQLREAIQLTQSQIETAWINVNTAIASQETKLRVLETALEEEAILTRRWETMAGDGGSVGTVLETLLDSQQRRTDAEREWVSAQVNYLVSLIEMQRAMGTLLIREGIQPVQHRGNSIEFLRTESSSAVDVVERTGDQELAALEHSANESISFDSGDVKQMMSESRAVEPGAIKIMAAEAMVVEPMMLEVDPVKPNVTTPNASEASEAEASAMKISAMKASTMKTSAMEFSAPAASPTESSTAEPSTAEPSVVKIKAVPIQLLNQSNLNNQEQEPLR